jgi:hypothetical protein
MNNQCFKDDGSRVLAAFSITGGGGNRRKVTYIGERNIMDLISMRGDEMFERDGIYYTCNGDEYDMFICEDKLTGYIDFDGDYDTFSVSYLDECDDDTLKLIIKGGGYIPQYTLDYINNRLIDEVCNTISSADVIDVATRLGMNPTLGQIREVLNQFDDEANNDPTATWNLIVENILYNIIEK